MSKTIKGLRKTIVACVGFPLLVAGIILIPLPGPGLIVCFIAFAILSLEFDWANKYLMQAKVQLKTIYIKAKERSDKIEQLGNKHKNNK